jgi:tetratricopeptide (TPR) repeat protein
MVGFLIIAALPAIRDAWQINQAGTLLNRAIVLGADASAAQKKAKQSPDVKTAAGAKSTTVVAEEGDYVFSPQAQRLLQQSMALMASAASRGPHTASREASMWRTYGAAASLLPSDRAFELLLRSRSAGRLDWYGELWLGEVASATGHWSDAASAYTRVDVSNLLVYRAEVHIAAGQRALALQELTLAKESLDALVDREKARLLLLDRTGSQPSALGGMLERPAERATTLARIGHGLLSLGRPADAQPVLEEGLTVAAISPPEMTVQRDLRLDLAEVLAQTLPKAPAVLPPAPGYSYYPPAGSLARLKGVVRIRALVAQALSLDHSAVACIGAGRILVQIGDDEAGVSLFADAIRVAPLIPDGYIALGDWYNSHGMEYASHDLYVRAAKSMPAQPSIVSALAMNTFKTGSHAEALPLLERAARIKATSLWVFAFLGDCYAETGRTADAKAAWEKGLRVFPNAQPLTTRLALLAKAAETTASTVSGASQ